MSGWMLFRTGVPLLASALGGAGLYAWLAVHGLPRLWLGPPLMLAAFAAGVLGVVRHRQQRPHGWPLATAGVLLLAGFFLPLLLPGDL